MRFIGAADWRIFFALALSRLGGRGLLRSKGVVCPSIRPRLLEPAHNWIVVSKRVQLIIAQSRQRCSHLGTRMDQVEQVTFIDVAFRALKVATG